MPASRAEGGSDIGSALMQPWDVATGAVAFKETPQPLALCQRLVLGSTCLQRAVQQLPQHEE